VEDRAVRTKNEGGELVTNHPDEAFNASYDDESSDVSSNDSLAIDSFGQLTDERLEHSLLLTRQIHGSCILLREIAYQPFMR
jgi:hypothetical protein